VGRDVKDKRSYNAALRREQAQLTRGRILDAARRLLVRGTYGSVTMEEIAREAGVAHQTVYAIFRTKLGLAHAMVEAGFHFEGIEGTGESPGSPSDPEAEIRRGARFSRQIHQTCADLVRFMRESGDPDLLNRYRDNELLRLRQESFLPGFFSKSGRLRPDLTPEAALDVIWSLTGSDFYSLLVFERGWSPDQYEEWLARALIELILVRNPGKQAPRAKLTRRSAMDTDRNDRG
jgi:AcrR family transcriptional regulator